MEQEIIQDKQDASEHKLQKNLKTKEENEKMAKENNQKLYSTLLGDEFYKNYVLPYSIYQQNNNGFDGLLEKTDKEILKSKKKNLRKKKSKKDSNSGSGLLREQSDKNEGLKTLLIDLDHVLIKTNSKPIDNTDFEIAENPETKQGALYVKKRPGVDKFL